MKKLFFNNKPAMTLYSDLLAGIKIRIRQAQNRAVMSANAEMLCLYWDIGRMVAEKQDAEGWGTAVIPRLSLDLRSDLPKIKGFSERNIRRMIQFYKEYPGLFLNWPRPVTKLGDAAASPDFRPRPVAEFDPNDSAQPAQGLGEDQVVQRVVAAITLGPQCHPHSEIKGSAHPLLVCPAGDRPGVESRHTRRHDQVPCLQTPGRGGHQFRYATAGTACATRQSHPERSLYL